MPKLFPVERWFRVQHLDVALLLANWRWLCPGPKKLVARSAFGDLFLTDEAGPLSWLNVAVGKFTKIADSEDQFRALLENPQNRNEWFGEEDERGFAATGMVPNEAQCIAFDIPLVFKEQVVRKPYLIDIYESVSFLGDLNKQIADVPDGGEIKLIIGNRPLATDH